jgi:hypothetical protein
MFIGGCILLRRMGGGIDFKIKVLGKVRESN